MIYISFYFYTFFVIMVAEVNIISKRNFIKTEIVLQKGRERENKNIKA